MLKSSFRHFQVTLVTREKVLNQTSGSKSVTAFLQPLKQNRIYGRREKMKFQKKLPSSIHGKLIHLSHQLGRSAQTENKQH